MNLEDRIQSVAQKGASWQPTADEAKWVQEAIALLDSGAKRVCEVLPDSSLRVHKWLQQAILLYFKIQPMQKTKAGDLHFYDKVPLKRPAPGVRVVPPATVRYGAFVESGAVLMPCYINIGARVGAGTMVDTWATVGSSAQVGRRVHLSGGVGLGGVLEPLGAQPVVIEDDVFLGSRAVVVEGVRVRKGAVIGAGVVLTASTPIIDVSGGVEKTYKGEVPENTVVVPGQRPKTFASGSTYSVPCALIIGKRHKGTDQKTALNEALRSHSP